MAKGKRYYRRKYRQAKRKASKGGIMGYRLMDFAQGAMNAQALGAENAINSLMNGDMGGAVRAVSEPVRDTGAMLDLTLDNVIVGVNRKLVRKFGGKFVRKFIA